MDQIHLYAYETLGAWHITVKIMALTDKGERWDSVIYRGDHVLIDEQDPEIRTVLILDQVTRDLNMAIRGELDTLAERPMEH